MGYRGHVTFSLVCYAGLVWALYSWGVLGASLAEVVLGSVFAVVGAILPDIDHPRSLVGQGVPRLFVSIFVLVFVALVAVPYVATGRTLVREFMPMWMLYALGAAPVVLGVFPVVLYRAVGHRGPTHSMVIVVGILAAGAMVSSVTDARVFAGAAALAIGWASHILADIPSGNGVMWLWPISERKLGGWGRKPRWSTHR